MRFLKSILLVSLIAFSLPIVAADFECKRGDSKCFKAKLQAQTTQSIIKIMNAGVVHNWNRNRIRASFTKQEQKQLRKLGFDLRHPMFHKMLKRQYEGAFGGLDANEWQSVIDTILHEDYVAKQVKNILLGISVVERLKIELANSGKKTIKSKSGNFSTRSTARTAVVVLEDLQKAQANLLKNLEQAGDDLDIEILANALAQTTFILVDRNKKVAMQLRNPTAFEKLVSKTSKSSGVAPQQVVKYLSDAAKPAMDVVKLSIEKQLQHSPQAMQIKMDQAQRMKDASVAELVVIMASDDPYMPTIPSDLSNLTIEEIEALYAAADAAENAAMMREYSRHANLAAADNIAQDTSWQKGAPGFLYHSMADVLWDSQHQSAVATAVMGKMDAQTAEVWGMLKDVEARVKVGKLALEQKQALEQQRLAKGIKVVSKEEQRLQKIYESESKETAHTLQLIMMNTHAATLLSNKQINYADKLFNDALDLAEASFGYDFANDLDGKMVDLSGMSVAALQRQMKLLDQEMSGDIKALSANAAYQALASVSVAKGVAQRMSDYMQSGHSLDQAVAFVGNDDIELIENSFISISELMNTKDIDKDLAMQAYAHVADLGQMLNLSSDDLLGDMWGQMLKELETYINDNAAFGSFYDLHAMQHITYAEKQSALNADIASVDAVLNNAEAFAARLRSQGVEEGHIKSYLQDQANFRAYLDQYQKELCQDSGSC